MDTFWITFGNDFGEGYKPDFRIHFNKPEQDEGYQCIKVCRYEVVEKLETENARYREALKFYAQNPKRENGTEFSNSIEEFGNLMGDDLYCVTWEPMLDLGQRARETLKEI